MTVTNVNELREEWPQDDSGRKCLLIITTFLTEKLLATAANNDCNPVSAPGESAADKLLAVLVRDFRQITVKPPEVRTPTIKPLHRFATAEPPTNPKP